MSKINLLKSVILIFGILLSIFVYGLKQEKAQADTNDFQIGIQASKWKWSWGGWSFDDFSAQRHTDWAGNIPNNSASGSGWVSPQPGARDPDALRVDLYTEAARPTINRAEDSTRKILLIQE